MPIIQIKCVVSEEALVLIDGIRGTMTSEQFLRRATELGICELVATAAQATSDQIVTAVRTNTQEFMKARTSLFSVGDPENVTISKPPSG